MKSMRNSSKKSKYAMHPKQNERAIRKMKALMSKRKLSNRFVMHPTRGVGAFCPSGFQVDFCCGMGGEGRKSELFIIPGAFAVLH